MKKTFLVILSVAILISSLSACKSQGGLDTPDAPELENVVDYTTLGDPYNTILAFATNPKDYEGQNIKITALSSVVYNFEQNRIEKQIMLGLDPTGCCNSLYEIRDEKGNYPVNGSETTFVGTFTADGYIDIYSWISDTKAVSFELDTLTMSSSELSSFVSEYIGNYQNSPSANKKIRIFGHLSNYNGYPYLEGLNGSGVPIWYIELHDESGTISFPTVSGNIVNPVEVIGTLSFYYEGNIAYPCIIVEQLNKVECVFK